MLYCSLLLLTLFALVGVTSLSFLDAEVVSAARRLEKRVQFAESAFGGDTVEAMPSPILNVERPFLSPPSRTVRHRSPSPSFVSTSSRRPLSPPFRESLGQPQRGLSIRDLHALSQARRSSRAQGYPASPSGLSNDSVSPTPRSRGQRLEAEAASPFSSPRYLSKALREEAAEEEAGRKWRRTAVDSDVLTYQRLTELFSGGAVAENVRRDLREDQRFLSPSDWDWPVHRQEGPSTIAASSRQIREGEVGLRAPGLTASLPFYSTVSPKHIQERKRETPTTLRATSSGGDGEASFLSSAAAIEKQLKALLDGA